MKKQQIELSSVDTRIISGQPLSGPYKNKKNKCLKIVEEATERHNEILTPDKYSFLLGQGSGKYLAEKWNKEIHIVTRDGVTSTYSTCANE